MQAEDQPKITEPDFDWEQWPERRAELVDAVAGMKQQFAELEMGEREELKPLHDAAAKFLGDMEDVITAGDEEYRKLHPGAQFEPS
jgi:chorismate mutase